MRTIICKKCGAQIDATLGECPNCGAVYYILPEDEDKTLEWAMSMDMEPSEDVRIYEKRAQNPEVTIHNADELLNADDDEIFNTRVWKAGSDPDRTRVIKTDTGEKSKMPVSPVSNSAGQRPVRRAVPESAGRGTPSRPQPEGTDKDIRKKQLFVAAVALLAVLTLILTIMGGAFDFIKDNGKDKMPNVLGTTQEAAVTLLKGMGLEVVTISEESEAIENTVIKQSIKEGKTVKKGDTVTLVISAGKKTEDVSTEEYIEVPEILGKTYDEAISDLAVLGLAINKTEDVYSSEDAGKIVSQSPMKGAKIKKGGTVMVTVSKGQEPSMHTITVTAGKGGSVSPKGIVTVEDGKDQTFEIIPDEGYEVREVKVDGTSVGALTSYTFNKVDKDHTLYVIFKHKEASASPSPSPSVSAPPSAPPATGTDLPAN
ncbi:MAG: PASTA domain-containing protein [Clostridiales bacterium]|nr:PASTA domain-containing protein [Clostridiales bacterium]